MKFNCTYCGEHIEATEEWFGKTTNCPHCSRPIRVPDPNAQERLKRTRAKEGKILKAKKRNAFIGRFLLAWFGGGIGAAIVALLTMSGGIKAAIAMFFFVGLPMGYFNARKYVRKNF